MGCNLVLREAIQSGGLEALSASPPPFQLGALQQVVHARPDREKGLPANREALLKALVAMVRQHTKL